MFKKIIFLTLGLLAPKLGYGFDRQFLICGSLANKYNITTKEVIRLLRKIGIDAPDLEAGKCLPPTEAMLESVVKPYLRRIVVAAKNRTASLKLGELPPISE